MVECEREHQLRSDKASTAGRGKAPREQIERKIQRKLDERRRSSVNDALASGYASLKDGIGHTYRSLNEIYEDIVPVSHRQPVTVDAPPLFRSLGDHIYVFSPEARRDLRSIRSTVSRQEGSGAGGEAIRQIICDVSLLTQMPRLGTHRPELLNAPTNFQGQFAIYYHPTLKPCGIKVARVLDGDRNINVV